MILTSEKAEDCARTCAGYRESKIYIIAGEKRISISMENFDEHLTEAGLDLTASLLSLLLKKGETLESLAGLCFESSLNKNDLPGILSMALTAKREKKK